MMATVSVIDAAVLAVLTVWLALTVAAQFAARRMLRIMALGIVPRWAFFAGAPIRVDYSLLLRDRLRDGSLGPWREMPYARERRWWRVCFNPASRCRRVVYTLTLQTIAALHAGGAQPLTGNPHYDALLRAALSVPGPQGADARETIVMRSFGFLSDRLPQAVVRSGLQPLPSAGRS